MKDIALHTVKVQNWDNTVTTYGDDRAHLQALFRELPQLLPHVRIRRRIKRTLRIDAQCVRFLTEEETARMMHFRLLHDYLE